MDKKGTISPRPYARLITMIGDQLIRNEKIALIELIKNSYDADATWVQIRFNGFEDDNGSFKFTANSSIEIEDNGIGMTFDVIKDSWLNPASPHKYFKKRQGEDRTPKGRIMQGEKGIGRYAVFKLGDTVEIYTRSADKAIEEVYVKTDLSIYDEELTIIKESRTKEPIFIDDIKYIYERNSEPKLIRGREITFQGRKTEREPQGTLIKISNLKGTWSKNKVETILQDCLKMVSPFNDADFAFDIAINGRSMTSEGIERLNDLLKIAPLKIDGNVDRDGSCSYILNGKQEKMTLHDMAALDKGIKDYFLSKDGEIKKQPHCGPFNFNFFVFDLERHATLESPLDDEDRELIRSHRIYLYRDGIRVYPYGDPSDDWLELDILRGTQKAGAYLSNDQITGYIAITSKGNPDLRDKTNREGLMDIGSAYQDIKVLVLGILGYLNKEFKKYKLGKGLQSQEQKKKRGYLKSEHRVEKGFSSLLEHLYKAKDEKAENMAKKLIKDYKKEYDVFKERIEIVEDLAAVGMTVEAASHDLMLMMSRATENLHGLLQMTEKSNFDYQKLRNGLMKLQEQQNFIQDQLSGIQPLFKSARRGIKSLNVLNIIRGVTRYYSVPMEKRKIVLTTKEVGEPLHIKCSEAVLLQVFINLLDNSIYWLTTTSKKDKKIEILIDNSKSEVKFADNGPGIKQDDVPYIFEPFFSTKGIKGRGLGLYIAQQLLERYDYQIYYINNDKEKLLDGANFLVSFSNEGSKD